MRAEDIYGPPEQHISERDETAMSDIGKLPAMWWVGILLALLTLRLIYEFAE